MPTRRTSSLSSLLLYLIVVMASAFTYLWLTLEDRHSASALHAMAAQDMAAANLAGAAVALAD